MSDTLRKFSESCDSTPVPILTAAASKSACGRMRARIRAIGIVCGVLGTSVLYSGDFSHYRGVQFGMNISAAAKAAGTTTTETTLIHRRPALIQEIEWQPRPYFRPGAPNVDPVKNGLLCFFNGELFRIVITYDRYKIEGMRWTI